MDDCIMNVTTEKLRMKAQIAARQPHDDKWLSGSNDAVNHYDNKGGSSLTKLNSQVLGSRHQNSKTSTNEQLEAGRGNDR